MIVKFIDTLFLVYTLMLFVRILGSWFPEYRDTRFMQFLGFYTDPYLNFFRKMIPPLGMIDLSPMVAYLVLVVSKEVILSLLG